MVAFGIDLGEKSAGDAELQTTHGSGRKTRGVRVIGSLGNARYVRIALSVGGHRVQRTASYCSAEIGRVNDSAVRAQLHKEARSREEAGASPGKAGALQGIAKRKIHRRRIPNDIDISGGIYRDPVGLIATLAAEGANQGEGAGRVQFANEDIRYRSVARGGRSGTYYAGCP